MRHGLSEFINIEVSDEIEFTIRTNSYPITVSNLIEFESNLYKISSVVPDNANEFTVITGYSG